MNKLGSMLICFVVLPIMSSERNSGSRTRSGSWVAAVRDFLTPQKRGKGVEKKRRYSMEQCASPRTRFSVIESEMEKARRLLPEAERIITDLPICPRGIQAMATPSNSVYCRYLEIVAAAHLETPEAQQKENRHQLLRATSALEAIQRFLILQGHFNITYSQQTGSALATCFDRAAEQGLAEFKGVIAAKLEMAQQAATLTAAQALATAQQEESFSKTKQRRERTQARRKLALLQRHKSTNV